MQCEIETEWELPMCLDHICTPMEIPISSDFMIRTIEINSSESPLSHLCSVSVAFGKEMVYDGPMGEHGFVMQITELEPKGEYTLKISANCSKLHALIGEPIEPVKVVIKGYEEIEEGISFEDGFTSEWA